MKSSDKFLIAIVGGIVVLVIIAIVIVLTRPEPVYLSEDTPEGIAHNYLLALEKEEYERAYSYLSPNLKNYPRTLAAFTREIKDNPWRFRTDIDATLAVRETQTNGDLATATIYETRFYGGDLFDSSQSTFAFEIELELVDGAWKISDSPYYFARCWNHGNPCK